MSPRPIVEPSSQLAIGCLRTRAIAETSRFTLLLAAKACGDAPLRNVRPVYG